MLKGIIWDLEKRLGINFKTTFCRASQRDVRNTPFEGLKHRFFELARELSQMPCNSAASKVARKKIRELFVQFGPSLWPDVGYGRPWLAKAEDENFEGKYPRDLYYSFAADYKVLRKNFCALITHKLRNHHGRKPSVKPSKEGSKAYTSRHRTPTPEEDTDSDDELAADQLHNVATRSATNALKRAIAVSDIKRSSQTPKIDQSQLVEIDDSDSSNGVSEGLDDNITVLHPSFGSHIERTIEMEDPTLEVRLPLPSKKLRGPTSAPLFLHIFFGENNMSESSRISLRLCDTVFKLFDRIDAQIPDALGSKVAKKIKIVQGQPTKTFRICKNGEFEFEAWKNFLDEEGGTGEMKPIGYAELA